MIISPAAKILAAALAVVLAISGVLGWQLKRSWETQAILANANKANLETIDRLESDAVIAQAAAIADAQERRKLETDHDELLAAARAAGPCDSLDAVIEKRRQQRQQKDGK